MCERLHGQYSNALPCQRCGGDDSVAVVVWVGSPDSERDAAERPRQCGRHTRMGRLSRQPSGAGAGRGAAETGTPAWCRPTRRGGVCRVRLVAWVLLMWAVAQPSAMSQPWRECVDIDMYGASPPRPGRIAAGRPTGQCTLCNAADHSAGASYRAMRFRRRLLLHRDPVHRDSLKHAVPDGCALFSVSLRVFG